MTTPADDWSAVADAWDRQRDYVETHVAQATETLVAAADAHAGDRLLELAAGPGALASRWASLVGPTGSVVISDIAPGMLDVARRRVAGLDNVTVTGADVSSIDEPDESFDVAVCRMGLMFAPDPEVAFAEIRRVLRSGGRLSAMTWGSIDRNLWMACVGMAGMMHGVVAGDPPVGPGGVFSLGDAAQLTDLAQAAGFEDVVVHEIPVTFRARSIPEHVDHVSSLAGPLASAFEQATPEQLTAVHETVAVLAADHVTDDGVALPGLALVLGARAG